MQMKFSDNFTEKMLTIADKIANQKHMRGFIRKNGLIS